MQHLVAAAVSGMQPNAVAIVDEKGELLSPGPGDRTTPEMSGARTVAASAV